MKQNSLLSLTFGNQNLQVLIPDIETLLLPKRYSSFINTRSLCNAPLIVVDYLEESDRPRDKIKNGWKFQESNKKSLSYFSDSGILFSIAYEENKTTSFLSINRNSVLSFILGIQHAMLVMLAKHCIGVHGVTLICNDQVIILSAPSGTGKTTLAKLLKNHHQAAIINGDFALLSVDEKGVFFEPTPFCGSSSICHSYRLKIDRIVFLEQSHDNDFINLDARDSMVKLMNNTFVPSQDKYLSSQIMSSVSNVVQDVTINRFAFAPTKEAADIFYSIVTT